MRIALIGARGQLGTDLAETLDGEIRPLDSSELDIADAESVERVLGDGDFDLVVNCAAYNQVDRAEEEPHVAYAVNALGARNLALITARHDVPFVHVSTDYVFGLDRDRSTPYTEDDAPGPVSAYGTSKLAGEYFARSLNPRSFVVRTCGLYGQAEGRPNFVRTMLRLGRERDELGVVNDQHCTPTSTADLAGAITSLAGTGAYGLYHATNAGATTWCELAREIFRLAELDVNVRPITTAEFGAPAARPGYSVLDGGKLAGVLGGPQRPWQDALADYVRAAIA